MTETVTNCDILEWLKDGRCTPARAQLIRASAGEFAFLRFVNKLEVSQVVLKRDPRFFIQFGVRNDNATTMIACLAPDGSVCSGLGKFVELKRRKKKENR